MKTEIINIYPLDDFVKLLPFEKIKFIDHIKSDCQGSDFDILQKANYALKRTAVYTIECENKQYYNTRNSEKEISKFFKKKNFIKYNFINKILYNRFLKNFNVDDPTFCNINYINKYNSKKIFIYQKG